MEDIITIDAGDAELLVGGSTTGDGTVTVDGAGAEMIVQGALSAEDILTIEGLGAQGPKGDKGDQGNPGPQGAQGIQGIQGATGPQGAQGAQGIQGLKGDTGAQGPKGDTGDVGPQGAQGIQGIQGPKADTGDVGPQGAQGIQGLKGDTGDVGPQGAQGVQGNVGPQGAQGPQGDQGIQGLKGDKGDPGVGDMSSTTYDSNADGKVNAADVADSAPWAGITGKPATFPPSAHTHPDATGAASGFMSAADKTKLDGAATGATANATDAQLRDRATHTGTQSADTITDGATNKAYTATEKTKLAGVATGATANDTDANLKNRANHTGTQTLATISDAGTAASKNTGTAAGQIPVLDGSGLIPSALLPSFVDDVLEYANLATFPGTGTTGKIYVTLDTNKTYRWSGSAYVEISASPGSTDAVTEGATNLYFTAARVLATVLTGLSTATNAVITASDTVLSALGKLQKQITDLPGNIRATAANWGAKQTFVAGATGNNGMANAASTLGEIMVQGNGTGAAIMAFYRPSAYAAYFGIDTDNKWKVGGWSAGAAAYEIVHMGNYTTLLGTIVGRALTISSSAPSGGVDGDVWFQV